MTDDARKVISRSVVIWGALLLLIGCDMPAGKSAVESQCRKDGGFRVITPVTADGFLTMEDSKLCITCLDHIGKGTFAFIDAYSSRAWPFDLHDKVGYYRVSRAHHGDARCDRYAHLLSVKKIGPASQWGMPETYCFAVEPLTDRPSGYLYSRHQRSIVVDGVRLDLDQHLIRHEPTKRVVATHKDYRFTSKLSKWLDLSGGGGVPDYTCRDVPGVTVLAVDKFQVRALHSASEGAITRDLNHE